jgi:hypothetical protein
MEILSFINFQKGVLLMAKNNSNNTKGLVFGGIIVIGLISYVVYKSKKNSAKVNEIQGHNEAISYNYVSDKVKEVVDKYFNTIKEGYRDSNLFNFYSIALDVKEYKVDYSIDENLHKNFMSMGLNGEENKLAYKHMKNIIDGIFKKYNINTYSINDIDYKSFLEEYYEILGKQDALVILKDKTSKTEKWNEYTEKNNDMIKELLKNYCVYIK